MRENLNMEIDVLAQLLGRFMRPGVPKYLALRDAFVHAVASGQAPSGARVPNEQELAAVLPLSLGTVQRALRQLVVERIIHRRPGMGSFVSARNSGSEMAHPFHCRFVDDSGAAYLPVFPEVLSRHSNAESGPWQKHLRCDTALEVVRRIRIGQEFYVFSRFFIDPKRTPEFASMPVKKLATENFKEVIFRTSGQSIHRVDCFMRQESVSAEIAAAIAVGARTKCTTIRALAFLGESDPIYYQQIFVPPTTRELHIVSDSREPGFE
jgi:GntR family transcriptional regulator